MQWTCDNVDFPHSISNLVSCNCDYNILFLYLYYIYINPDSLLIKSLLFWMKKFIHVQKVHTFNQCLSVSLGEVVQQCIVAVSLWRPLPLLQGSLLFGIKVPLHGVYKLIHCLLHQLALTKTKTFQHFIQQWQARKSTLWAGEIDTYYPVIKHKIIQLHVVK